MGNMEHERWLKKRAACERWKAANHAYYVAQKRRCAHRPEYLAHRREKYRRSNADAATLSAIENNDDNSKSNEGPADGVHCPRHAAPSPEERHWTGLA